MCGDTGEMGHREGPAQAVTLQVDVHQVLVSEDQSLGVLVLQVVHHGVIGVAPAVQVGQAALPPAEVAHLTCTAHLFSASLQPPVTCLKQVNAATP